MLGYKKLTAVLALASVVWAVVPQAAATGDAKLVTPISRAVTDPASDLAEMQARFDEAVRVVEEAEAQLRASVAAEEEAKAEIDRLDAELTRLTINEYMDGGAIQSGAAEMTADPHTAVQRRTLVDVVAGDRITVLADLRSAKDRLVQARPEVEASLETARVHRGEMDRQVKELKAAQERKAKEDLEAALAAQRDAQRPKPPPSGSAPLPTGGGQVSVRGIVVHQSIASNLDAMLGAADAAGVRLSGSGYRDPAAQLRIRQANCPDPVNSPASACSPPTAKPGESMHERGLAIDFTYNGSLITSRSNPGFRWLAANAPRFGFANLPSEPWHWSVNGN